MSIPEQISASNNVIASISKNVDKLKLNLETSNRLLVSFLDSFEQIFLLDPSIYSYEDCELYIESMRFLGKTGIVNKVEEHLNNMPA